MNYNELVRLATTEGPMRDLALQALMDVYTADDRVDNMLPRGRGLDAQAYVDAYAAEAEANPKLMWRDRSPIAVAARAGDRSIPEMYAAAADSDTNAQYMSPQAAGVADLMKLYDKPWYEDLGDMIKGIDPKEAALGIGNAVTPVYSQLDSENWARENLDKYFEVSEHDPLAGLMYLPNVVLGTAGMIPGASQLVSGTRKLGKGTQMLLEGMF